MLLRKLYLKIRLYLYSIRETLNRIVITTIIIILVYSFINAFLLPRVVLSNADASKDKKDYKAAISWYNAAYAYYKINHFSQDNRNIYFDIPYQVSLCYLRENDRENSVKSMLEAVTSIQSQYGMFSSEAAYFSKKYLIQYYLENNKLSLAKREFNNVLTIYRNIGYTDKDMADIVRLSGDIYYQQKDYDTAIGFYEKAYNTLAVQANIDYEIFFTVVNRMCDYYVANNKSDEAIDIYSKSIAVLKNAGKAQTDLAVEMLLKLGDLYDQGTTQTKQAIASYEEAVRLIKTMPRNTYLRENIVTYLTTLKGLYNQDGQFHKVDEIDVELARKRRFSLID